MGANDTIRDYFVCVGAQKAGTTWLARTLSRHPDVFVTPVKEIHYFDHVRGLTEHLSDRKRRSRYRKYHQRMWTQPNNLRMYWRQGHWYRAYMSPTLDDEWYRRLFALRGTARFAGEATPEYAIIGEDGYRHLQRLAPDARIIFILRNPVTRAWSQALHYCRSQRIDAQRQTPDQLRSILAGDRFTELGDYAQTLDALFAVFPKEQVKVLFYEDMHANRLSALQDVCGFIGTDFSESYFPALGKRFNTSQRVALPQGVRADLQERFRPLAATIGERLGRLPAAWTEEFKI